MVSGPGMGRVYNSGLWRVGAPSGHPASGRPPKKESISSVLTLWVGSFISTQSELSSQSCLSFRPGSSPRGEAERIGGLGH